MKTITEMHFLSCEKMLRHGQVAIRYQMRSRSIWQWEPIIKFEKSMFLHLFGIASIAVIENQIFYI